MKLQEHRAKLDQHKMYLMHIAAEADIVEQQEDSVRNRIPPPIPWRVAHTLAGFQRDVHMH